MVHLLDFQPEAGVGVFPDLGFVLLFNCPAGMISMELSLCVGAEFWGFCDLRVVILFVISTKWHFANWIMVCR